MPNRRPAFPSTTAALRFSPRSFARFIGDLLKARENSSCAIPSRSRASVRVSLPPNAARGANAGSFSSVANRTFHGHTSWEICRHTCFEIPLTTGRRTL